MPARVARLKASPCMAVTFFKPSSIGETARGGHVFWFVIAQCNRDGDLCKFLDGFQHIPPRPGCDVEQVHRFAFGMNIFNRRPENFLEVHLALTNTAPADAVEIRTVNRAPQRSDTLRPVFINVVQRAAGIETSLPTQLNPPTQSARRS